MRCFLRAIIFSVAASAAAGGSAAANGQAALEEARQLISEGRRDPAITVLLQAVAREPRLTEGWTLLGNTELAMGRTHRAITAYQRALNLDDDLRDVRYNLAYALRQVGQFKDAVRVYRTYLRTAPRDPDALYGLAEALKADTQWAAAADMFELYATAETRPRQTRWATQARVDAEALRRRARARTGASSDAAATLAAPGFETAPPTRAEALPPMPAEAAPPTRAEALPPPPASFDAAPSTTHSAALNEGLAFLRRGAFGPAKQRLSVAVAAGDNDPVVLSALASAHLGLGQAHAALAAYRRALLRRPVATMVPALEFGIAEAHRLARNHDAAYAALRRVLADPSTPDALRRLAEERAAALRR